MSEGRQIVEHSVSVNEYKELNRTMWAFGDYRPVAELLRPGAETLVERLAIEAGERVLDVATGSGNVALAAARRGARVLGIDLTPEYLALARARVAEEDLPVELREGDAEDLDVGDEAFDVVTSTFGAQFAPRHARVATEMVRACRIGGRIGMGNWTPSSWTAEFQAILNAYFPPAPDFVGDAMRWGDPGYVRALFGPAVQTTATVERLRYPFAVPEDLVTLMERTFGPAVIARHRLGDGWADARQALVEMTARHFVDEPGFTGIRPEYLLVIATKDVAE
jgi:SAM-dependent methyltransferase